MRGFILIALISLFLAACSSAPQVVVQPAATEQKIVVDRESSVEKLKPRLGLTGINNEAQEWIAYVSDTEKNLEVKRYDVTGKDIILSFMAEKGHLLKEGDLLETSSRTKAEIIFRDGTTLRMGPKTVLKINYYWLVEDTLDTKMNLLTGSVRINTGGRKKDSKLEIYAPNVAVNTQQADFAVRYNSTYKTTYVGCFSGTLSSSGPTDADIGPNGYMTVETTYDGTKEAYIVRNSEKLKTDDKKEMLESFQSAPEQISPWEFTNVSSGYLRFLTGIEYSKFKELSNNYYSWTLGYVPLIHLGSVVFFEPYIEAAFATPFTMTFFRTGGRLEFQFQGGFYFGLGAGIFWVSKDIDKSGPDLGLNLGYTFISKPLDVIDGLRLSYASATTKGYHQKAFMLSVLMNFYGGRELY